MNATLILENCRRAVAGYSRHIVARFRAISFQDQIRFWLGVLSVSFLSTTASAASAQLIAVPPQGGTNNNGISAFRLFDRREPARFQQVYDASAFNSLAEPGGGLIAAISLRVDVSGHPFIGTVPDLQVNLSTTLRSPDGLSTAFDENVGRNDMIIVGRGPIEISSGGGGGFSIFDLFFDFREQPFFYNPADGNLLIDFRIYEGFGIQTPPQAGVPLDAYDIAGDSVSSVYGIGTTLPTSGQVSSLGLATRFHVIPIPEPSTWALLFVGVAIWVVCRRMLRNRKGVSHVIA
jgi:hypothetical protein